MTQKTKKLAYCSVGLVATGLAIAGVILPAMPATVFVLIALWAFSQSSDRLHRWLTRIPILKYAVIEAERFQHERTLDLRVKLFAQLCSWTSFVVITLLTHSVILATLLAVAALGCSAAMFVIPTKRRTTVANPDTVKEPATY